MEHRALTGSGIEGALDLIGGAEVLRYERVPVRALPVADRAHAGARTGWIVALYDRHSDAVGFGDVAPLVFDPELLGRIESDLLDAIGGTWFRDRSAALRLGAADASIRFGMVSALADLRARASSTMLHRHFDPGAVGEIDVNALVDARTTDDEIDELLVAGYGCFKMKVGRGSIDHDAKDVRRVRERIGDAALRLDANRAWTMAEAYAFFERTSDVAIDYIEEPLAEADRLAELFYRVGWPLALDESVPDLVADYLDDDEALLHLGDAMVEIARYAGAIVLKPTKLGSPYLTHSVAECAGAHAIRPVISSSFESGFGTRTLAALAACSACAAHAAGLATQDFFQTDACVPDVSLGSRASMDRLFGTSVTPAPDLTPIREWGIARRGR